MNETAQWFFDHGVNVFPLRNTPPEKRKEPAVKWREYRALGRDLVGKFANYGVPLGIASPTNEGIIGVIDTDNPEAEAWVASQPIIPRTPLMVRTGKGWHRYFRLREPVDKFIHRAGQTIEFRNEGQYVVGPGSLHPNGHVYEVQDWSWVWNDIPYFPIKVFQFNDGTSGGRTATPAGVINARGVFEDGFEIPDRIHSGERHDILFRAVRSMKALQPKTQITREQAHAFILDANDGCCDPPLDRSQLDLRWFNRAWDNPDRPITISNPPALIKAPF